ncbi:MAG: PTS sugar transporter subunit IIA [Parachlamydiaceae bacterium]|nr:PTS sugar transporter subunit IIA [Parachlamydiaceae bacterium]
MVKISKYFDPQLVLFLEASTRDSALQSLVSQLDTCGKLKSASEFYHAIVEREKIVSTGIGMGVAIPHAKLPEYKDFFIAIAILQRGVDWNSLDGVPVKLIFMIGGPDNKQTEYLQILSSLTTALKDEERRKKLLTLNSPAAIIGLFDT